MPITRHKMAYRAYYCPMCKYEQEHSTNHTGEIYCPCKACEHPVLYFSGAEEPQNYVEAVFHYYHHDISKPDGLKAYVALREKLEGLGYVKFYVLMTDWRSNSAEKPHDGSVIKLYDHERWQAQFASSIGRVHSWLEWNLPNKAIRCGHWLERK